MSRRIALFVLLSAVIHAAALLGHRTPVALPEIGGQQRTLRLALMAPPAPATQQPPHAHTPAVTPRETPREQTIAARAKPAAEPPRRSEPRRSQRQAAPPAAGGAKTAPAIEPPVPVAMAVRTQGRPDNTASPDLAPGRQISEALKRRLARHFHYPWLARKRGWQGEVTLALRVEGDGQLSHLRVAHTSGYKVLDESALDSARKIKFLPEAPHWLRGDSLNLLIPVRYRLIDS